MHLAEKKEYFAKSPISPEDTAPAIYFEAAGKVKSV